VTGEGPALSAGTDLVESMAGMLADAAGRPSDEDTGLREPRCMSVVSGICRRIDAGFLGIGVRPACKACLPRVGCCRIVNRTVKLINGAGQDTAATAASAAGGACCGTRRTRVSRWDAVTALRYGWARLPARAVGWQGRDLAGIAAGIIAVAGLAT
jgi:hypothetical protein